MRRLSLLALLLAAAALAAGCGSDDEGSAAGTGGPQTGEASPAAPPGPPGASAQSCETGLAEVSDLRATGVGCDDAATIAGAWANDPDCVPPAGASRGACPVREYRCLSAAAERGISVNCAARGRSISFLASPPAGS